MDVEKLLKGRPMDNLEFLQWLRGFFEVHFFLFFLKGRPMDNLEFLQWLHGFFEVQFFFLKGRPMDNLDFLQWLRGFFEVHFMFISLMIENINLMIDNWCNIHEIIWNFSSDDAAFLRSKLINIYYEVQINLHILYISLIIDNISLMIDDWCNIHEILSNFSSGDAAFSRSIW